MIKQELRSGQVLEIVNDEFQYTPVGSLVVYEDLNAKHCLLVNNEHAYLSEIEHVKKHAKISETAVDFDYRQVIINDRKMWFISQIQKLERLCNE